MSAYTKGPWEVCEDGMIRQQGDRGLWVSSLVDIPARDGGIVATDANARLIAASPELLEALKAILMNQSSSIAESNLTSALAAIAKAEGRE